MSFILTNAGSFVTAFLKFSITTPKRIAEFFAQIHHESKEFTKFTENLNYSVEGLLKNFSRSRISAANASLYGRTPGRKANQEAIANLIYGGLWGKQQLGNLYPGDGWKFRGRTPMMITGRKNYQKFKEYSGIDVVSNPDLINRPDVMILASAWFWGMGNPTGTSLNGLADQGKTEAISKIINGGRKGLQERKELATFYKNQNITIDVLKKKNQPNG